VREVVVLVVIVLSRRSFRPIQRTCRDVQDATFFEHLIRAAVVRTFIVVRMRKMAKTVTHRQRWWRVHWLTNIRISSIDARSMVIAAAITAVDDIYTRLRK
jgi:hypothetical protein